MAIVPLRRWAAEAAVPTFVACGGGAGRRPLELAGDPRVRLVPTPRQATVLLAAGRFPGRLGEALDRVHDQLPTPRAVVWWTAEPAVEGPAALVGAMLVASDDDIGAALVAAHHVAVYGGHDEPDTQPDAPPHPFEGRGDHGQGGEGMMGGVPYGRPMAMTGDDRDGLALDRLPVKLGPFLVGLPGGLIVRAVLQGGVLQESAIELLDLGAGADLDPLDPAGPGDAPRRRLRWLTEALLLAGLPALAARAARLTAAPLSESAVRALARAVRRSGLCSAWRAVGVVAGRDAADRLDACLAAIGADGGAETGAAAPTIGLSVDRLAGLLVGQDWADALVTICSLDVDPVRLRAGVAS